MKKNQLYCLLPMSLVLSLIAVACQAEVYRWTDEDGNVQFGDRPPKHLRPTRLELRINTYQSPSIESAAGSSASAGRVVMYSASWCGACKKAKAYFERNNVRYTDYDVETSERGRREFAALGARGVPVILVGRKRLNGFSAAAFEKIYQPD